MIPGLNVLVFVLLTLGLIVGLVKPKKIGQFLLWLIFGPLLMGLIFHIGTGIYDTLPLYQQIIFLVLVTAAAFVVITRLVLPREIWNHLVADILYDILKAIVLFPFRALGWVAGQILIGLINFIGRFSRPRVP